VGYVVRQVRALCSQVNELDATCSSDPKLCGGTVKAKELGSAASLRGDSLIGNTQQKAREHELLNGVSPIGTSRVHLVL
jgi:hypothetical protein